MIFIMIRIMIMIIIVTRITITILMVKQTIQSVGTNAPTPYRRHPGVSPSNGHLVG